jgi:6-phosphogluconolactonase
VSTVVEVFPDSRALVGTAGDRLIGAIQTAVAARGRALLVLTGGGNGIALLQHLGAHGQQIDWSKVHLFWGDDRYVPEDDDERNDKQARAALLDHIDVPSSNVHAMPASDGEFAGDLAAAALAYEQVLAANAEPGDPTPNFDVHLLGMGPEGHITLTLPAIRRSREVWLMVSGAAKAEAAAAAIGGADPISIPAAGAIGLETTLWLLDEEAAAELPG